MKTSLHSIKLKHENLTRCNTCNSLHETNGKYENLSRMKSQLSYEVPLGPNLNGPTAVWPDLI